MRVTGRFSVDLVRDKQKIEKSMSQTIMTSTKKAKNKILRNLNFGFFQETTDVYVILIQNSNNNHLTKCCFTKYSAFHLEVSFFGLISPLVDIGGISIKLMGTKWDQDGNFNIK